MTSEPDNFPWYPESFSEIFYSGDFIKNDGTTVKAEEVKGKVKGVYFSAHWVCTGYTSTRLFIAICHYLVYFYIHVGIVIIYMIWV